MTISRSMPRAELVKAEMLGEHVAGTIVAGSSLKFCRIAEGVADLYPRFGPTMEWDTAAGHAVLLCRRRLGGTDSMAPARLWQAGLAQPAFHRPRSALTREPPMSRIFPADDPPYRRARRGAWQRGELVSFPTETVYGLGGDATNDRAVAAICAGARVAPVSTRSSCMWRASTRRWPLARSLAACRGARRKASGRDR